MKLGIEGEHDYPQVLSAPLEFLKDVSFGKKIKPANSVAIIGGGNAAIDGLISVCVLGPSRSALFTDERGLKCRPILRKSYR